MSATVRANIDDTAETARAAAIGRPTTTALLLAAAILLPGLQAIRHLSNANANFQVGMDFRLTYAAAAAWSRGLDPYDDSTLKSVWLTSGMAHATPPGLPQTPNVYPLTVAVLLWPLTLVSYPTALAIWLAINAACVALMLCLLIRAGPSSDAQPIASVALVAAVLLFVSFPLRYGLLFGNLAVWTTTLMVGALCLRDRPALAGVLLGLSLVKYSLSAPLAVYLFVTGRRKAVGVALLVQCVMVLAASIGYGSPDPTDWFRPMLAAAKSSLAPGGINHFGDLGHTALHLELASLLYRLQPELTAWRHVAVGLLLGGLIFALVRYRRHASTSCDDLPIGLDHVAVIAVTLLAFYHRTYDLIAVLLPLLWWLAATHQTPISTTRRCLWAAVLLAVLPAATMASSGPPSTAWARVIVQPLATWALLVISIGVIVRFTMTGNAINPWQRALTSRDRP